MRLLLGLEEGTMPTEAAVALAEDADPALLYFIFTWIRRRYADHPNGNAIVARLVAVLERSPDIEELVKEGEEDPVVEWFEDEYSYRDLNAKEFIELIVEKLEG